MQYTHYTVRMIMLVIVLVIVHMCKSIVILGVGCISLFDIFLLGKSVWELIFEQFDDLLVKILLLAAVISFVSNFAVFNDKMTMV